MAYAIGVAQPMNITVDTEGTGVIPDDAVANRGRSRHLRSAPEGHHPDAGPVAPDLLQTAAYGHFGREEPEFTWERTDKAAALRAGCGFVTDLPRFSGA